MDKLGFAELENKWCTRADFSKLFGYSGAQIGNLVNMGVLSPGDRGLDFTKACRELIGHIQADKRASSPELRESKAKLEAEKARTAELKRKQLEGSLVPLAEVEHQWATLGHEYKDRWLALPARLAGQLDLTPEVTEAIRQAVVDVLADFATSRPEAAPEATEGQDPPRPGFMDLL